MEATTAAPLLGGIALTLAVLLGGCGGQPASSPGPVTGSVEAAAAAGPASVPSSVVVDADPYDGAIGSVVLTPSQVAYRDALGLTDLEAHDAFRYSCSLTTVPSTFVRYANQAPTSEEEP